MSFIGRVVNEQYAAFGTFDLLSVEHLEIFGFQVEFVEEPEKIKVRYPDRSPSFRLGKLVLTADVHVNLHAARARLKSGVGAQ